MIEGPRKYNIESTLTPEQVEQVMAKVQDINEEGIGFHAVGAEDMKANLAEVLVHGLLGVGEHREAGDTFPEKWSKNIRDKKDGVVHLNITGRFNDGDGTIKTSHYGAGTGRRPTIIFDLSSFKEKGKFEANANHEYEPRGSFMPNTTVYGAKGKIMPNSAWGFALRHRVAPRFFRGLVFNYSPKYPEDLTKCLEAMQSAYSDNPQKLLPIYDAAGNLLWPRHIIYEEVKKLVAEMAKKKSPPLTPPKLGGEEF